MTFRYRILAVLALGLLAATSVSARPALWVAKDADTTIYLFGTVHLLPHDTDWRFPALQQALDDSQALYIELTDDNPMHMSALVLRYGMDPGHPLSQQLTGAEERQLEDAAKTAGVPGGSATLQMMRPWLAALTLSVAPLVKAGLDPQQGVDKQLKAQMSAAGKPVRGLETAEQQIRFLADMPPAVQLTFLRSTLREMDQGTTEFQHLVTAWKDGDVAAIAKLENDEMRVREPQLYQRLLVTRNAAWAKRIAQMLQQPGTIFIAVGAAHLAGPDSVQAQLAKLGIHAARE